VLAFGDVEILIDLDGVLWATEGQTAVGRVLVIEAGEVYGRGVDRIAGVDGSEEGGNVSERGVIGIGVAETAEAGLGGAGDRWTELMGEI